MKVLCATDERARSAAASSSCPSTTGFENAWTVAPNGNRILVPDYLNGTQDPNPTARTMGGSYGSWMGAGVMAVDDADDRRFLLYVDGADARGREPA